MGNAKHETQVLIETVLSLLEGWREPENFIISPDIMNGTVWMLPFSV